jgi:hypothetical protein
MAGEYGRLFLLVAALSVLVVITAAMTRKRYLGSLMAEQVEV